MATISISFHHWPKCRHFLHLQPLHHLKFLILFLHQTGFVKYYLLLRIKYWPGWEVKYLRSGKGFKALSSKFQRNFIDQSEFLEREPDIVEREEQNKKSKVAEMWNGLHFFNLKSQSSQEHRKSYQVEAKSIPQTLLYISHSWLLPSDQNDVTWRKCKYDSDGNQRWDSSWPCQFWCGWSTRAVFKLAACWNYLGALKTLTFLSFPGGANEYPKQKTTGLRSFLRFVPEKKNVVLKGKNISCI